MSLVVVGTGRYLEHGCVAIWLEAFKHSNSYPNQTILVLSETTMPEERFREHFRGTLGLLPNVLVFLRPGKHNKAANLNFAFEHITQPIVTQFDVDDFMHPQRLDVMHRLFTDHPDLEYVMHTYDMIYEPPKGCVGAACRPRIPPFQRHDLSKLELGVPFTELRGVWLEYMKTHEFHFCCPLLKKQVWAHNGWPTFRRVVPMNLRYSLVHWAEDSVYFSQAVKQGYNVTYIDIHLGLYNLMEHRKQGMCPHLGPEVFAQAADPLCD